METFKKFNLNENESRLICDSLNGMLMDFRTPIWKHDFISAITESIELFGLSKKWLVNAETLIKKLESLPEYDTLALITEVETFWGTDERPYQMFGYLSPMAKIKELGNESSK